MTGIILLSVSGLVYLFSLVQYIRLFRIGNIPLRYALPCVIVIIPLAGRQLADLFYLIAKNPSYSFNLYEESTRLLLAFFSSWERWFSNRSFRKD